MGLVAKDDGWLISDALWERIEPLPPRRRSACARSSQPRVCPTAMR